MIIVAERWFWVNVASAAGKPSITSGRTPLRIEHISLWWLLIYVAMERTRKNFSSSEG